MSSQVFIDMGLFVFLLICELEDWLIIISANDIKRNV